MPASPDDIDVSALWASAKRGLPRVLVATGMVGVLTYGALTLVPPSYRSTAQIILQSSSSSLLRPSGEAATGSDLKIDENEVASQAEVIRSRDLLTKVVATLKLGDVPEFNPALKTPGLVDRLLGLFSGTVAGRDGNERALNVLAQDVKVGEVPKTRLINIDVTTHDAKRSADIANAIAAAFLDRNRSVQVEDASAATTSIATSIAEVKTEAEAAEADLERFRVQSGLISGQNKVSLSDQQLTELNTQLTQATAARTEAEARAKILRQMLASGTIEASQDVVKSPNMQQLFQQKLRIEHDIAELSTTLLPGHPRMRQLTGELAVANTALRQEAKQVAAGIEDDLKVAAAREAALQASIAKLTEAAAKSGEAQAKLSSLEREVQSKRNAYDAMLQRLNEASSRRSNTAVSAMAALNERAEAAGVPDSPKKTQMTVFAMLATLLLGLVWLIGRALMGAASAGAPKVERRRAVAAVAPQPAPRLAGIDALAAFARNASRGRTGARIMLTAEDAPADAVAAATQLADKLASQPGDLVMLDLSLSGAPGLAELAAGSAAFEDAVAAQAGHVWHRVGAGKAEGAGWPGKPQSVQLILEALAASYHYVLIAGPRPECKAVLEALEGQLDAGIVCGAANRLATAVVEEGFLGYDVADMQLAWLDPAQAAGDAAPGRSLGLRRRPAAA